VHPVTRAAPCYYVAARRQARIAGERLHGLAKTNPTAAAWPVPAIVVEKTGDEDRLKAREQALSCRDFGRRNTGRTRRQRRLNAVQLAFHKAFLLGGPKDDAQMRHAIQAQLLYGGLRPSPQTPRTSTNPNPDLERAVNSKRKWARKTIEFEGEPPVG